jgi:hypothetical protein
MIILGRDIWGSGATPATKLFWILLIIVLPVIGLIHWFFAGPRGSRAVA